MISVYFLLDWIPIALLLQFQGKANTIKYGKIFLLVN